MRDTQGLSRRGFLGYSTCSAGAVLGGALWSPRAAASSADLAVVLATGASPADQSAAAEIQLHLGEVLGVEIPILDTLPPPGMRAVLIGRHAAAPLVDLPDDAELGEKGWLCRRAGPHLIIAGTADGGTLHGVHEFLEQDLDIRWLAPGHTRLPRRSSVEFPDTDRIRRPAFRWRHTSYAWPGADAAFLARQRDNQGHGGADHAYGRQIAHDGRCHTYFRYLDPTAHFDAHPEWFSEIGGQRRRHETQLCLTNPEVLERVAEAMLARMDAAPDYDQYNFSQMDYYSNCECARCSEMNARLQSPGGTQFWFCNELAARTSAVHPDKLIGTLAYMYTEAPPVGLEIHPNVAVWLCHMFPSCDSHPIATCPRNADYKDRAERWAGICRHLYVWHYIVDFAHYYNPFPNLRAMAADIRFYRDIGVEGVFLQGMGEGGGGGEFSLLRPYYGMRLLWNPDADPQAIVHDFLTGYHGPAAEPIARYIDLVHDEVERGQIHMHLYTNPAQGYLSDAVLDQAGALFDAAEAAVAEDPELLERVRVARMPLTYARAFPRNGYRFEADRLVFNGPLAQMAEAQDFVARMQRHGFRTLREREGDPAQLMLLTMFLNAPVPLVSIENEYLRADTVPFLGGRLLRLLHKPSGRCVTANNRPAALLFPFHGGEECRFGGIYEGVGNFSQFSVAEQSDHAITLEVRQPDGLRVRRRISLPGDGPELAIETTVLNAGAAERDVVVRSHLDLDLGPLTEATAIFTDRADLPRRQAMPPVIAGHREGIHFRDRDTPRGGWSLHGAEGLAVTQRFDDAVVDFTWLVAYPADLSILEVELWRRAARLAPGEEVSLFQTLQVEVLI